MSNLPPEIPGKCNAAKKGGGRCTEPAGWGTDHVGYGTCKMHLGTSALHARKAGIAMLHDKAVAFGASRDVDPDQAVLEAVRRAAGAVDFYEEEIGKLPTPWVLQKMGSNQRIDPHPAVVLYHQALDELFNFSERTMKLGLYERQVQMEEAQVLMLAKMVTAVIDDPKLGLSQEQKIAGRRAAAAQLRQLVPADDGGS